MFLPVGRKICDNRTNAGNDWSGGGVWRGAVCRRRRRYPAMTEEVPFRGFVPWRSCDVVALVFFSAQICCRCRVLPPALAAITAMDIALLRRISLRAHGARCGVDLLCELPAFLTDGW